MTYNQAITVTPGTNYTFSVLLGSLPPGYTLSTTGVLSGVTNQTGAWTFTVKALLGGCQGTKQYTLTTPNTSASTALAQTADYDGDGRSDFAVWSGHGTWRLTLSKGGAHRQAQTTSRGGPGTFPCWAIMTATGKPIWRSSGPRTAPGSSSAAATAARWSKLGASPRTCRCPAITTAMDRPIWRSSGPATAPGT